MDGQHEIKQAVDEYHKQGSRHANKDADTLLQASYLAKGRELIVRQLAHLVGLAISAARRPRILRIPRPGVSSLEKNAARQRNDAIGPKKYARILDLAAQSFQEELANELNGYHDAPRRCKVELTEGW